MFFFTSRRALCVSKPSNCLLLLTFSRRKSQQFRFLKRRVLDMYRATQSVKFSRVWHLKQKKWTPLVIFSHQFTNQLILKRYKKKSYTNLLWWNRQLRPMVVAILRRWICKSSQSELRISTASHCKMGLVRSSLLVVLVTKVSQSSLVKFLIIHQSPGNVLLKKMKLTQWHLYTYISHHRVGKKNKNPRCKSHVQGSLA